MKEYKMITGANATNLTINLNDLAEEGYEVEQMSAADDKMVGESVCYILLSKLIEKQ